MGRLDGRTTAIERMAPTRNLSDIGIPMPLELRVSTRFKFSRLTDGKVRRLGCPKHPVHEVREEIKLLRQYPRRRTQDACLWHDDNLPAGLVVLHVPVGRNDIVQRKTRSTLGRRRLPQSRG